MKTITLKTVVLFFLFAVFSCKKKDSNVAGISHHTTNCMVASNAGGNGYFYFFYNSKNQIIAYTQYNNTGTVKRDSVALLYNGLGQLTGMGYYKTGHDTPAYTGLFLYNAGGALVQYNQFTNDSSSPYSYDDYTSDAKGNIVIDSSYALPTPGMPVLNEVADYTYDANGNAVDMKIYTRLGALLDHSTYTYDNGTSALNNLPLALRITINSCEVAYYTTYGNVFFCNTIVSNYNNVLTAIDSGNGTANVVGSVTNTYLYNDVCLPVTETSVITGQPTQISAITYNCH